jgi:peptide/nickel transport system substrate-binding protein
MNRRILSIISLIAITAMLLAACGTQPTPAPVVAPQTDTATAVAAAPAAAEPAVPATDVPTAPNAAGSQAGKYLTINVEQVSTWLRNFNPFSPDVRYPAQTGMYEPLMVYNKSTGKLVPWLATEYSWNADNTVLTFKIRQGVLFSDGQPFSAKDVLFTFDMLKKNPALATVATSILTDNVTSVVAPDDFTVVITFSKVYTPALFDLSNQYIVPEHIWKDVKDPVTFTNENPVGTGPFTEVTRFDDQVYIVEKNPHYWQEGKPYIQGLKYPAYPGNDQANMALANGDIDWAGNFVPDIEKTYVSKDPANFHYYFTEGDTIMLYINPKLKPFDDPAVRKAVSLGIDRKMIVDMAEYNYIPPSDVTGLSSQYAPWKTAPIADADNWALYDVKKANDSLDALGLKKGADGIRVDKEGKPMKYTLSVVSGWTDWVSACQVIAQNMKDLGINITVQTPEYNAWMDEIGKGQHQWSIGWSSGGPTPYNFYRGMLSKQTVLPVGEAADENWNRYVDPEADKLMDEFVKTSDDAKQKEIMSQIEAIFIKDAPALPLFPGPDWYEYSTKNFTGWPSKEDAYAPGAPYDAPNGFMSPLFLLTTVKPK